MTQVSSREDRIMVWDSEPLEAAVHAKHGDCVAKFLNVSAKSIYWKLEMRDYHVLESERIFKDAIDKIEVIPKNASEEIKGFQAIALASVGDPCAAHLFKARLHAEAHMIAAAQSLHSTADIMAQVVYWAFNLLKDPCARNKEGKFKNVTLWCVRNYLKKHMEEKKEYKAIFKAINALLELDEFKYLSDYVNTTKHRSLVEANYTAHLVDERLDLRIEAFSGYDALWGKQFLREDAQQIGIGIVAIGNALNAHYANAKGAI